MDQATVVLFLGIFVYTTIVGIAVLTGNRKSLERCQKSDWDKVLFNEGKPCITTTHLNLGKEDRLIITTEKPLSADLRQHLTTHMNAWISSENKVLIMEGHFNFVVVSEPLPKIGE